MYQSQMITDAVVSDETNVAVCTSLGLSPQSPIQYMVFQTQVGDKTYRCCFAGGTVDENNVNLTPIGSGAYEALQSLPGNDIQLFLLQDDEEALRSQVAEILDAHQDGDRLCFISDTLVERQALLSEIFSLT